MTEGQPVTRCPMPGPAGDGVTDLGAIRRCDAVLDLLAGRRLGTSVARRDPALAVLSVLAADVDGAAARLTGSRRRAARAAARPPGSRRSAGRPRQLTAAAAIVAGALAALGLAVVAAGTTGIVIAGLLTRVARLGTGFPAGPPDRGRHAARHRRR